MKLIEFTLIGGIKYAMQPAHVIGIFTGPRPDEEGEAETCTWIAMRDDYTIKVVEPYSLVVSRINKALA